VSFEFKQREKVPKAIRRVVTDCIDKALKKLRAPRAAHSDVAVHSSRQRFKEIRSCLRLVRSELGDKIFRCENRCFRDAARPLSTLRDAKVLIDTLDDLIAHFHTRVPPRKFAPLKRALQLRRREIRQQVIDKDRALPHIIRGIKSAKKRIDDWPLKHRGFKAIAPGLRRVYTQGREVLQSARHNPTDAAFHEFRKRAKDLRYQLTLLRPISPATLNSLVDDSHHLTDLLGSDHDLAVLRTAAQAESTSNPKIQTELLHALIDERRHSLQQDAIALAEKLYEEPPKEFVKRLKSHWKTARQKPIA